ncbi:MAG: LamG domain-containing protein [Myxococcales bacterium]|nr:LamG domain-containing protein [Myxococcales bacterium]
MGGKHRWWRTSRWAAARWGAIALGVAVGCAEPSKVFVCASPDDCGGNGTCEATGYCSFPDADCASGSRYGAHASSELAGTCVDERGTTGDGSSTSPDPTTMVSSSLDGPGTSTGAQSTGPLVETTSTTSPPDTSSGEAESTGPPVERVTEGLLALYLFDEGEGTTVHDVSGVGSALDLTIEGPSFGWVGDGLRIEDAIARTGVPASKIINGCEATEEVTIEAWVTPLAADMEGPARIVTLSVDSTLRNFTLGQGVFQMPSPIYVGRLRTSDGTGSDNGVPQLTTGPLAAPVLTHLVYLRSIEGYDRLYVDGQLEAEGVRTGDFSTWSLGDELACGNELSLDRPWAGTLHLVAIYGRALTEAELGQNIDAGF